ncbi:H/ACA ribonucleoprotein complex subunit GAR1-like isoform X1 [Pistacia vera]|uniref:H/ACA ribonucleoprotein complex subunit GAR1-like isoform X1 n=2 Tax=Pistacia vera TaxID=55513 RepID=UPI0012630372|nr:H/ACA ribonucleoprotein complex subunit GAR1-like isoform X1 [Pistacia vera]XP_031273600.1 H/ACA ribonucleoprotein complex subunit GAR1-like isoform X1 [Pistacia vera]
MCSLRERKMDRYQKVEKPRTEAAISENELRITAQGRLRNYISYAISLLQDKGANEIILKATGRAINKTVMIAELLKRRIVGLHQNTSTGSIDITDTWEPLEEGLLPLETTRHVSVITIILSKKELDSSSPGYQSPIPVDQVKPLTEYYDGEAAPGMRGRVRHDQGQGKNGGTGNGLAEYSNGHWDGGRGYGGRGRGYARGRSSRGRGRWYGGGNMQHESGYNNGYSGSGAFPPQGRGRGRGRGSGHGHGLGFRSDGPVQVQATA